MKCLGRRVICILDNYSDSGGEDRLKGRRAGWVAS